MRSRSGSGRRSSPPSARRSKTKSVAGDSNEARSTCSRRASAARSPERGGRGAAVGAEDHELSVDERAFAEPLDRARDLREEDRRVAAARVPDRRARAVAPREHAVAVVARLEEPRGAGGGRGRLGREHRPRPADTRGPGPEPPRRRHRARHPVHARRELLEREARDDRLLRNLAPRAGVRVAVLEEEPLLLAARVGARPDERPLAAQLVAGELEHELPVLEPGAGIRARRPGAAVPHDDCPRAVIPRGDDPLEVRVLERVVLHLDGHPPVGRVVGRALRHGPAAQGAVELEPEVEVQASGGVLLDDEQPGSERVLRGVAGAAERLGRAPRIALLPVAVEAVGHEENVGTPPS